MFLIPFRIGIYIIYVYALCLCIHIRVQPPQHYTVHMHALWTSGLVVMLHCIQYCMEHSSYLIHFNQQVEETSAEEDPDSNSPTPPPLPYPHLVENYCASSVFVHEELVYPSTNACPLHQDVSPHTHNWHCVVSGKTINATF